MKKGVLILVVIAMVTATALHSISLVPKKVENGVWHNGDWHERVTRDGKDGYMVNDTFVSLTPEEMEISNTKKIEYKKKLKEESGSKINWG